MYTEVLGSAEMNIESKSPYTQEKFFSIGFEKCEILGAGQVKIDGNEEDLIGPLPRKTTENFLGRGSMTCAPVCPEISISSELI